MKERDTQEAGVMTRRGKKCHQIWESKKARLGTQLVVVPQYLLHRLATSLHEQKEIKKSCDVKLKLIKAISFLIVGSLCDSLFVSKIKGRR